MWYVFEVHDDDGIICAGGSATQAEAKRLAENLFWDDPRNWRRSVVAVDFDNNVGVLYGDNMPFDEGGYGWRMEHHEHPVFAGPKRVGSYSLLDVLKDQSVWANAVSSNNRNPLFDSLVGKRV